jgi:hypothetical protein
MAAGTVAGSITQGHYSHRKAIVEIDFADKTNSRRQLLLERQVRAG